MKYSEASVRPLSKRDDEQARVVPQRPDREHGDRHADHERPEPASRTSRHAQAAVCDQRERCERISGALQNSPSFMIASSLSLSCRIAMLDSGSPSTSSRSASQPSWISPSSLLHHHLPAPARGRDEGLHRRHAEVLHEVLEVLGVLAVRRPGEAVVAAGQHADAALEHRLHALAGRLELELVAHALRDRCCRCRPPRPRTAGG